MKSKLEWNIKELVMLYHARHCDTHIVPKKYVYGENDSKAVLVWLNDLRGNAYSVLDMICNDAHGEPYVTELISVSREYEEQMLQWFRGEISDEEMRRYERYGQVLRV